MYKHENKVFKSNSGNVFKIKDDEAFVLQLITDDEEKALDLDIDNLNDYSFKEKYNINKDKVITFGSTDNISTRTLAKFIDKYKISRRTIASKVLVSEVKVINHFECFSIKDFKKSFNPIHEDYHSSWNCLMEKYKHPDRIIIYIVKAKKSYKFKDFDNE